jgi:hypothetical protein
MKTQLSIKKKEILSDLVNKTSSHLWNLTSQDVIPLRHKAYKMSHPVIPSLIGEYDVFKYLTDVLVELTKLLEYEKSDLPGIITTKNSFDNLLCVVRYQLKMFFKTQEYGKNYDTWGDLFMRNWKTPNQLPTAYEIAHSWCVMPNESCEYESIFGEKHSISVSSSPHKGFKILKCGAVDSEYVDGESVIRNVEIN